MTKEVPKHAQTTRRPRQGKLKRRRRRTYRVTEENKENDPQEGRTIKATLTKGKRCFERGIIQTRKERGLKNKGIQSNRQRMSLKAIEAIIELSVKIEKSSLSSDV